MTLRFASLSLLTLALAGGCFVDRTGTRRGADAATPDAARMDAGDAFDAGHDAASPRDTGAPRDANCAPGTVDVDNDPANGCECTIATPADELCNGRDDDCDPDTFDGQAEALLFESCDGDDADRCEDGAWVCNVGAMACTDPLEDSFEMCGNTVDEDCDGAIDESRAIDVTTWYRDMDMDGYGTAAMSVAACAMPSGYVADMTDCDDTTPSRSPGLAETCNGRDDDCSGLPDETGCPCDVRHRSGVPYMFCTSGLPFSNAVSFCAALGYRLVKIEEATENAWVAAAANSVASGSWWIGLRQDGSNWDWTDGSRATYLNWASGEPNDGNDIFVDEDCVEIYSTSAQWNDQRCGQSRPFVCEWP